MSNKVENDKDCLECRLVGGFSFIAIGCYIYSQAVKRKRFEGNVMKLLAAGTGSLGVARLFNMF